MDIGKTGSNALSDFHKISTNYLQMLAFKAKKAEHNATAFEEYSEMEVFYNSCKFLFERMDIEKHSIRLEAVKNNMEKRILTEELSRVYTELTRTAQNDLLQVLKGKTKIKLESLPTAPDVQMKLKKIPITKPLIPRAAEKVNKGEADLNKIFDFFTFTKQDLQEYINLIK